MRAVCKLRWIASLMVVVGLAFISSCKDDKEEPKAKVSFESAESEIYENDAPIDVKIKLDKAAAETVVLSYSLTGTATKLTSTGGDYDVSPDGTITIPKGESEGTIEIEPFEDGELEVDYDETAEEFDTEETIIVTITGVVSGPGELLAEGLVHTVSLYEDDMLVILDWETSGEEDGADMDLILSFNDPDDSPDEGYGFIDPSYLGGQSSLSGSDPEAILIVGGFNDGDYGLSYVYYDGTDEELPFGVTFLNFGGTINGSPSGALAEATYTLANINNYMESGNDPQIVQTMTKSGLDYEDLTTIEVPEEGSRLRIITGNFGSLDPTGFRNKMVAKKIAIPQSVLQYLKK